MIREVFTAFSLGVALGTTAATPAHAAPGPLVPSPVTIVNNNDDSTRSFRYHYPTSSSTALNCAGSYKVLAPGTSSQAWVSDVNSMRFYEDARVAVKSKDGAVTYKVWGVNVAETTGASRCYGTMTNDRLYEVLTRDGANAGLDQY